MDSEILNGYIDKVYGFAFHRTYSQDEADELSQEILYTAVKELPRLRDENRFEPWLWGIANNVAKTFRRNMGKQRAMYTYDSLEYMLAADDLDSDQEELYSKIREKVAMLSSKYREIIIRHYFDNLTTKQIAKQLEIPEGTVTWRLSAGREKLKRECANMNETALRPIKMDLSIMGSGNYNGTTIPWPTDFINDALAQNIFHYCYETPKTVEELANLSGIPAYFIEDRVKALTERNALREPVKGKYQTDFIIYTDKVGDYCAQNENLILPILDNILAAIKALAQGVSKIGIYTAGKAEHELAYLYGVMAFSYLSNHYNPAPYIRIEPKYDGNSFAYVGSMESAKSGYRTKIGIQHSANLDSNGTYNHTAFNFGGFSFKKMMYDNYINVCEKILCNEEITDKWSVAKAIEEGYIIRRDDGSLFIPTPALTKEQKERFDESVEKYFAGVIQKYSDVVLAFSAGYKNLFPKHLKNDVERSCYDLFIGLYSAIIRFAQESGKLDKPATGSFCDVLIQFK